MDRPKLNTIYEGDAITVLRNWPDSFVNCTVTSPPYWNLRNYGVDGQLGLEKTPMEYVEKMVEIFREVRRVLRNNGTLWLNLGDSYAQSGKGGNPDTSPWKGFVGNSDRERSARSGASKARNIGLKPKDLIGIPWMLAFALRDDGWYLRSDIIWEKINPMPESVQGSHFTRHKVTIEEYERLSGLPYTDERAGDAWAGDMPLLSEREIFSSQAPLSAKRQGQSHGTRQGVSGGRAREAETVQSIMAGEAKQSEIRSDSQRRSDSQKGDHKISRNSAREAETSRETSTHEGQFGSAYSASQGKQQISSDRKGKGVGSASTSDAERRDPLNRDASDSSGLAANSKSGKVPLLLLQEKTKTNDGSCRAIKQGRAAYKIKHRPRLRPVQLEENGQDYSSLLVGCPGCDRCIQHHGYIFHLSAGRPTRSHEYLFLLTKSAQYFYDADAIKEPASLSTIQRLAQPTFDFQSGGCKDPKFVGKLRDKQRGHSRRHAGFNDRWDQMTKEEQCSMMRNKRDVWSCPTAQFDDAHFATFPEDLITPCVLAGSPVGGIILDPFMGAGTSALVAAKLNRRFLGIELNPEYIQMAENRVKNEVAQVKIL